jgi:hypothetical protein
VNWAQDELLPIAIEAPADRKTRDKWLNRLWRAIEDDGVDYLWLVQERWGELCGSKESASYWADQFLDPLRAAWSDKESWNYVRGTSLCLSSLVAAGRHRELLELLALQQFRHWQDRQFGMRALLMLGRTDEALAYAEASRGLNQPDAAIDAACEKVLLDVGRVDEAYDKYALTANSSSTGLATFRTIVRKYPAATRRTSFRIWPHRAVSPAGGLPPRKRPAFAISPLNLPTRAAPIRARSAAHRATFS